MTSRLTRITTFVAACALAAAGAGAAAPARAATPDRRGSTQPAAVTTAGAGQIIAFERTVPGVESRALYTVRPTGGSASLLRSEGEYARWSPDGRQLAFLACLNPPDCTTALALMDRATGDVHFFLRPDPELEMGCSVWAPSGRRLACGALDEAHPTRNGVYSIRESDGKGLTRITRNPGGEDGPLAYSPDGRRLLFTRMDPSRPDSANQALFITPVAGGQPHRITPWGFSDDWAGWSPDGRTIVFGMNGFLYRVDPDGHGLVKIGLRTADAASARSAFDVSFSPDGSRIVFSVFSSPGIYTARPDGSDVRRLTSSPTDDHHADWGPAPGA